MEENRKEEGLIVTNQRNMFCSLDLEEQENKVKLYNATEQCDVLLNDIVGQTIEIKDVYIEEYETVDKETGEVKNKFRTILFGSDGKTYASGAYGIYNSLRKIFTIFGDPTQWESLKLKIYKRKTKTGTQTLCLKVEV